MVLQILLISAGAILFVAGLCWLIELALARQRRERDILRSPAPDFALLEDGGPPRNSELLKGVPLAGNAARGRVPDVPSDDADDDELPLADGDECLPVFDAVPENDDGDLIELERAPEEDGFAPGQVEITSVVEPRPIFGDRSTVRQSQMRAMRHMDRCVDASNRLEHAEAEAFCRAALREINGAMKRDHWYAPYVLSYLAYLRYEQGFSVEARELWEQAEQGALEWFEQCQYLLPGIRSNLKIFWGNF